jgi:PAS domain S-box-containing protein
MTSLAEYITFLKTLNEASAIYTDKVIWASPQYLKLLGYKNLDEVKGTTIYSYNHPDDLIDQQKNITHRKNTRQNTSGTWRFRRKDSTYITIHSKGSVITLDEGTYYVAIARSHQEITLPEYTSGTIKHETLTPLTTAQGYIEIIETRTKDQETLDLLRKAQTSLEKLNEIIQKQIDETQQLNLIKQ